MNSHCFQGWHCGRRALSGRLSLLPGRAWSREGIVYWAPTAAREGIIKVEHCLVGFYVTREGLVCTKLYSAKKFFSQCQFARMAQFNFIIYFFEKEKHFHCCQTKKE